MSAELPDATYGEYLSITEGSRWVRNRNGLVVEVTFVSPVEIGFVRNSGRIAGSMLRRSFVESHSPEVNVRSEWSCHCPGYGLGCDKHGGAA